MIEKIIVNVFMAILELICVNMLCLRFKTTDNKRVYIGIASVLIYLAVAVVNTVILPLLTIIINISILIAYTFTYNIKFYNRLLVVLIWLVIAGVYEIIVGLLMGFILGVTVEEAFANIYIYLISVIIAKFAMYITIKLLVILVKPKSKDIKVKYSLLNTLLPISSLVVLWILSYISYSIDNNIVNMLVLVASILLIISNIAAFVIFDFNIKNSIRIEQQNMENVLLQQQKIEMQELLEQQLHSNQEIHDIKHKMFTLKSMLDANNSEATNMVNELCNIYTSKEMIKYTNLPDVDILLNTKKRHAELKKKNIQYSIVLNEEMKINTTDLCVLLGNILDNAIEHSVNGGNISMHIGMKNDFICIKCVNTTEHSDIEIGVSTKNNKFKLHGYGLTNMAEIVKTYEGRIDYTLENQEFEIKILLKNGRLLPVEC